MRAPMPGRLRLSRPRAAVFAANFLVWALVACAARSCLPEPVPAAVESVGTGARVAPVERCK
jgi:hypothetical protein